MFKTKTKRLFFASILFFLFLNMFLPISFANIVTDGTGADAIIKTDIVPTTTQNAATGTTPATTVTTTQNAATGTTPATTTTNTSSTNTGLVGCDTNCTFDNLITMINKVISFVMIDIVPPIAAVTIVIAAINLMTSSGDPGKLEQAKKTIIWIILGLVVIYGAWAIVRGFITALGGGGETLKFFSK
jgi:hypothetical protein